MSVYKAVGTKQSPTGQVHIKEVHTQNGVAPQRIQETGRGRVSCYRWARGTTGGSACRAYATNKDGHEQFYIVKNEWNARLYGNASKIGHRQLDTRITEKREIRNKYTRREVLLYHDT